MPGHTKKKRALPKKYGKMPIKKMKREMGDVKLSSSERKVKRKGVPGGENIITEEIVQAGRSRGAESRYKKASKLENRKQRGNEMASAQIQADREGAGRIKVKTFERQQNMAGKGPMTGARIGGTVVKNDRTQYKKDGTVIEGSVNRKDGAGEKIIKAKGRKITAQKIKPKSPEKPKKREEVLTKHSKPALFAMKPKMDGMPKFSYAAMQAKKAGKKSFEYAGKTFPVKKGTYGSANKALYKSKMPAMYKLGVKGLNALDK